MRLDPNSKIPLIEGKNINPADEQYLGFPIIIPPCPRNPTNIGIKQINGVWYIFAKRANYYAAEGRLNEMKQLATQIIQQTQQMQQQKQQKPQPQQPQQMQQPQAPAAGVGAVPPPPTA